MKEVNEHLNKMNLCFFVSGISSSSIISAASSEHIRCIYTVSLQEDIYGYDMCCSAHLKREIQILSTTCTSVDFRNM